MRKLNDGGKLEMVQVNAHNTSDYEITILRPRGRKKSRRARTEDILECEGGRLDP